MHHKAVLIFMDKSQDNINADGRSMFDANPNCHRVFLTDIIKKCKKHPKFHFLYELFYPLLQKNRVHFKKFFVLLYKRFQKKLYNAGISGTKASRLEAVLLNWLFSYIENEYSQEEAITMKTHFERVNGEFSTKGFFYGKWHKKRQARRGGCRNTKRR